MKATRKKGASDRSRVPRYEAGVPGSIGKQGEIEVAHGNVYPASGPLPPGEAKVQPMASWGQGERGAAGYEDAGPSEIIQPERFSDEARSAAPRRTTKPPRGAKQSSRGVKSSSHQPKTQQ